MKTESIERLELAAMGTKRPERAQAAFELARRLRELVPLLEEIQHDTRKLEGLRAETAYDNACLALALAKGGEER